MSFPRYEKYKDSGVEWLGEVPEGWEVISIKWLSPVQRGASPRPIEDPKYFDESGEYAWVRIADVSASDGVLRESEQQLSELGSSLSVKLQPGELFISIAGTVGKPCLSEIKACIHDGFVYFPRLTIEPKFLYRIFEAGVCYQGLGKFGTQLNLNTDTIGSIRIALPPQNEISAVLSFLDRETGKIDALVSEQERLIELLTEKRQSVISHAVTKGLDPDAPMKDSGIKWLGEVPEGWEVKRLKYLCKVRTGDKDTVNAEEDGLYPFYVRSQTVEKISTFTFDCEAVLTAGDGVGVGKVFHYVNGKFDFHQRVYMMNCFRSISAKFFFHYLATVFHKVALEGGAKSTVDSLRMPIFMNFLVTIPSVDEQKRIIKFVESETAKIDTLIGEAQQAINLLKERKSALISAAVTGKIDVRGFQT